MKVGVTVNARIVIEMKDDNPIMIFLWCMWAISPFWTLMMWSNFSFFGFNITTLFMWSFSLIYISLMLGFVKQFEISEEVKENFIGLMKIVAVIIFVGVVLIGFINWFAGMI